LYKDHKEKEMKRKEKGRCMVCVKLKSGSRQDIIARSPGLINADENSNAIGPPIQTRTSERRIIVHRM
jgi:hypothetical protein